ncbi:hypothetical protein JCM11251_004296 [Rhodosporidiobolus azoricus]
MSNLVDRFNELSQEYAQKALDRYRGLSPLWKALFWFWVAMHFVMIGGVWYIGMDTIFAYFAGLADSVRQLKFGWLLLSSIVVLTSLPPLIGYGTAQTIIGYAWGVYPGFFISAGSCLAGGAFAFLVLRRFIHWFAPYLKRNPTFDALSKAVKRRGLPLIIMIRLCPFPYPYSNLFFASIETVSFWEFILATLTITPKLLLHVFVGHRMYLMSDPNSPQNHDSTSYWLNMLLMFFGSLLGFGVSYYLYRETMRIVEETNAQVPGSEGETDLEAGLLDDVDEMLAESSGRTSTSAGEARGGVGKGVEVGRQSEDRWSETFSDFGVENVVGEQTKREERLPAPYGAGTETAGGGRRDSEAWGLGDLEEEEELEMRDTQRAKRAD